LTSHKHQSFAFAEEEFECDSCGEQITPGQLISIGKRTVEGDMEIENDHYDVAGVDRIHVGCRICMQDEGVEYCSDVGAHMHCSSFCYTEHEETEIGQKLLSIHGKDVRSFPGYVSLSREDQEKYLREAGADLSKADAFEAILAPCHGVVAVVTMDPDRQNEAKRLVTTNGGKIENDVTADTTHLIYGPKFKFFSTLYGVGSPKYAAAKRRGVTMLTMEELRPLVTAKTRLLPDAELARRAEERAKAEAEKEAAKAARAAERAANKGKPKPVVEPTRQSSRRAAAAASSEPEPPKKRTRAGK